MRQVGGAQWSLGSAGVPGPQGGEEEDVDASHCYARVRGQRERASCLTLKSGTGNACSIEWTWCPHVVYTPGLAPPLTLLFPSCGFKVEIDGTNLGLLAEHLGQHRVIWIQAQEPLQHRAHAAAGQADEEATYVERLRVLPMQEGEDVALMRSALQGWHSGEKPSRAAIQEGVLPPAYA